MTRAPENLLAVRRLLIDHLDNLEPGEVGIVGDVNHRGGYHCGSDRVTGDDYSVRESPRDSAGLTLEASALDVGMFEVRVAGKAHNLRSFSIWCVAQCKANAPDTRDIREIIYSPDGRTVKRFDRLGKRSTGDSSHLKHTHFSFFRDAIKAGRDQTPLFRRYLTHIGLIQQEDIMATLADLRQAIRDELHELLPFQSRGIANANPDIGGISLRMLAEYGWSDAKAGRAEVALLRATIDELAAALARVSTGGTVDTTGLLAGIDKRLAAVRADLRDAVADLGEGGAAKVRGPQG